MYETKIALAQQEVNLNELEQGVDRLLVLGKSIHKELKSQGEDLNELEKGINNGNNIIGFLNNKLRKFIMNIKKDKRYLTIFFLIVLLILLILLVIYT